MRSLFIPVLVGLVALPSPTTGQFEAVRTRIEQILESDSIASIAVAVAKNGEVLWEEGFGWADIEGRVPASEHVMYPLASVTKPLTATGLMVLVERGIVDLDVGVNEYLGDTGIEARVGDVGAVTPRRLANHSSGLPGGHMQLFYSDEPGRPPTSDELVDAFGVVVYRPGARTVYSNLGFGVLGHLISTTAGKDFADYMREDVFEPLGMTRSSVGVRPGTASIRAHRYFRERPLPHHDTDAPGAADGYSSAHDLVRFALFHLDHRRPDQRPLLTESSVAHMREPSGPGHSDGTGYGVGWLIERTSGGLQRVGHNGGLPGVDTRLAMYPEEDLAIVLLANTNTGRLGELERMIVDAALSRTDPTDDGEDAPPDPSRPGGPFDPDERLVGVWNGHVEVGDDSWPISLDIRQNGEIHLLIQEPAMRFMGGEMWSLLNRVTFRDDLLLGFALPGNWTSAPYRRAFMRRLRLTLEADVLYGSLTMYEASAHTRRSDTLVAFWVSLTREE